MASSNMIQSEQQQSEKKESIRKKRGGEKEKRDRMVDQLKKFYETKND